MFSYFTVSYHLYYYSIFWHLILSYEDLFANVWTNWLKDILDFILRATKEETTWENYHA